MVRNLNAANISNNLNRNTNSIRNNSSNIASGNRINRAADDAANLAVLMKMRTQIGGTSQAINNTFNGISAIQTAEGALGGTHTMLERAHMLSVQAANGTLNDAQRGFIQAEIDQIMSEVDRVAGSTNYNGINLLDGSLAGDNGLRLQIGADNAADESLTVSIEAMDSIGVGLSGVDVRTQGGAQDAIARTDAAISRVSMQRASLGAAQNRLEHTASNLINAESNLTASASQIGDANMAEELIEFTKNNLLQQANIAMLAHQIKEPQGMMQLLNSAPPPSFMA